MEFTIDRASDDRHRPHEGTYERDVMIQKGVIIARGGRHRTVDDCKRDYKVDFEEVPNGFRSLPSMESKWVINISSLDYLIEFARSVGGSLIVSAGQDELPHITIYDGYVE